MASSPLSSLSGSTLSLSTLSTEPLRRSYPFPTAQQSLQLFEQKISHSDHGGDTNEELTALPQMARTFSRLSLAENHSAAAAAVLSASQRQSRRESYQSPRSITTLSTSAPSPCTASPNGHSTRAHSPLRRPVATQQTALHPTEFPDGGTRAWLTVLGGFCCLFCSFGWINCIGVFQGYYETHQLQSLSSSVVSWISSLEVFIMFFCGPVIGKWIDDYGTRWPLMVGTVLQVSGLMLASVSHHYYQILLSQGVLASIGASCIFYPVIQATTATASWFIKRRAFAFGIVTAGSSVGGVVLPIMVAKLVPLIGFGWTMRAAAFIVLVLLIIANLAIRSRVPPLKKPLNVNAFTAPLREVPYCLTVCGTFLFFLGMFLPLNYIQVEATRLNISSTLIPYIIPILNAVSIVGRVLPGYIADKSGRYNMQIAMSSFTSALVLGLWLPSYLLSSTLPARTNQVLVIVFASLYGFSMGAFVTLVPAVIAQISPDVRHLGVRQGTAFAIVSIAALIGNPIGGALLAAAKGSFAGMMLFTGMVQLLGAGVLLAARLSIAGPRLFARI